MPTKDVTKISMKNSLKNHYEIFGTLSYIAIFIIAYRQRPSFPTTATQNHSLHDGQTDQYHTRQAQKKKLGDYTHLQHSEKILNRKVFMTARSTPAASKKVLSITSFHGAINGRTHRMKKFESSRVDIVEEFVR